MSQHKKDIEGLEDIKILVDNFYYSIQRDNLLGPIFHAVIKDNWTPHLEKMYSFWNTILFDVHSYSGRPFPPHADLPIQEEHFNRWLSLFENTVDQNFEGSIAENAKFRANKMAELFQIKLNNIRKDPFKPLV